MILLHNRTVKTKCCEPQNNKCDEPDDDDSDERKFTLKIKATNKSKSNNNKNKTTQTNDSNGNHSGSTHVEYTRRQNSETAAIDEDYYENMSHQSTATNGIPTGRNHSYGVHDRRPRRFEPSSQNHPVNHYYENP